MFQRNKRRRRKIEHQEKYHDTIRGFDQRAKDIWGNSYLNMTSDYKSQADMQGLHENPFKQKV